MRPPEAYKKFFYCPKRFRVDAAFFTGKKSWSLGELVNTAQGKNRMAATGMTFKLKIFKPEQMGKLINMKTIVDKFKAAILQCAGRSNEARIKFKKPFDIAFLFVNRLAARATDPSCGVRDNGEEIIGLEIKIDKASSADKASIFRKHFFISCPTRADNPVTF